MILLKLKLLVNNLILRGTKILRVLPLITLIKNKINVINDFIFSLINKIKDKIYVILFGPRLGTYSSKGELLYPIVILNNKILFEMVHGNENRWQNFCDTMFRDSINWGKDKEKIYEAFG
jgi:hypothetical protein